jgi:hypothetical protein
MKRELEFGHDTKVGSSASDSPEELVGQFMYLMKSQSKLDSHLGYHARSLEEYVHLQRRPWLQPDCR